MREPARKDAVHALIPAMGSFTTRIGSVKLAKLQRSADYVHGSLHG